MTAIDISNAVFKDTAMAVPLGTLGPIPFLRNCLYGL